MADIRDFDAWFNTLPIEMRQKMNANDLLLAWLHRSSEISKLKRRIEELEQQVKELKA